MTFRMAIRYLLNQLVIALELKIQVTEMVKFSPSPVLLGPPCVSTWHNHLNKDVVTTYQ